ncbi:uncharacterized protein LOC108681635 [Hyalella azteca]|uniref:Uncharacterized protein LOC108681635 n=1 Tax=Hyalella azteca TaxID=294128 RepID=A0A8B7PLA2_HYAAZ|nr:uncharacterized protein LOC108681635 [Hyalella azteca]
MVTPLPPRQGRMAARRRLDEKLQQEVATSVEDVPAVTEAASATAPVISPPLFSAIESTPAGAADAVPRAPIKPKRRTSPLLDVTEALPAAPVIPKRRTLIMSGSELALAPIDAVKKPAAARRIGRRRGIIIDKFIYIPREKFRFQLQEGHETLRAQNSRDTIVD